MECPKCQFNNREGANFCIKCGAKFEVKCFNCGNSLPSEALFCDECGQTLSKRKDVPSIDYSEPQSYTPKHLIDKILTTRSSIEGERKLVTVFFADVADYTSVSEKSDPEKVHQIMDGTFKILMDEVHKYEGTINQFTGDGVMALFGAPVAHEDHAQRACYAALSIQKAMETYGEKIEKDMGVAFKMRIGLNSGPVIVGAIGDDLRMDYTAVGDTTNLGSRMESMAIPGTVLVSGNTHRLVGEFFEFKSLGKIEVKGKKEPQAAFELIKAGMIATRIGASVAKGLTRFVGRKNSMATLLNAFDKVKAGSGQVVGLVGEAGGGKSRLLLEMRNVLLKGEYNYLEGRCIHYGGSMPYLPMLDVMRSYFDIKEGDREFIIGKKINDKIVDLDEMLVLSIPLFKDLLSLKTDDTEFMKLDPKAKREKAFEALRSLIIRLSHEKPLILAIEDLHWIDETSNEFIDYLIGSLANNPILLILLYRPEYTHQWGSKSYYSKVGITQLGMPSSSELIKAILEDGEVAPELKQLILSRSAGNPLFMEEFTHTLLDNGSIERNNELYILNRKASEIEIPDTIQGIISARLDRLEDNLKRTMQVASVIGRDFSFRILQTITGMREELKSHLLNLQGLEFIYEKSLFPELEYIFKHALTQEVAYNSLLISRRKELHKVVAEAIEALFSGYLDEQSATLSYHYESAGIMDKAFHYLTMAAKRARAIYANKEAIQLYKRAIEKVNKLTLEEKENFKKWQGVMAQLQEDLGDVLELAGKKDEGRNAYQKALEIVANEDLIRRSCLLRKIGKTYVVKLQFDKMLQAYEAAESILGSQPVDPEDVWWHERLEIQFDKISLFYFQTKIKNMRELIEKLRPLVEAHATAEQKARFFQSLAMTGYRSEIVKEGVVSQKSIDYCLSALSASKTSCDLNLFGTCQFMLGFSYLWGNHFKLAEKSILGAMSTCKSTGNLIINTRSLIYISILYRRWGQLEKVRAYIQRCLKFSEEAKMPEYIGVTKANMAWVAWHDRDLRLAEKNGKEALEIWRGLSAGHSGEVFPWLALWPLIAVALYRGKISEATEYAQNLFGLGRMPLPANLAELIKRALKAWETGLTEKTSTLLGQALDLAQELNLQ